MRRLCTEFAVWEVTERRDGAIYRTRDTLERIWVPVEVVVPYQDGDILYVSTMSPPQRREDWVIVEVRE